jgi:hypothetical protein
MVFRSPDPGRAATAASCSRPALRRASGRRAARCWRCLVARPHGSVGRRSQSRSARSASACRRGSSVFRTPQAATARDRRRPKRQARDPQSPRPVACARTLGLGPTGRRRRPREVDQILHLANARDLPRRDLDALNVLLSLHYPAQKHDPILCVDADLPLGHTRATVELTLDLARERHVVERLAVTAAGGVERAAGDPNRVRLCPPGPPRGTPFAAPQPRQRTMSSIEACGRPDRAAVRRCHGAAVVKVAGRGAPRCALATEGSHSRPRATEPRPGPPN